MTGCTVPNCTNSSQKGFRLYHFPSDRERKLIWVQNCGRERGWKPTKHTCVCEAHFDESQFESHRADGLRKLKPNAVPTIFNQCSRARNFFRKLAKEVCMEKSRTSAKETNEKQDAGVVQNTVSKVREGCRDTGDSFTSVDKEPDHTYPKHLAKPGKINNEVGKNVESATTEEVFIKVSVASEPDNANRMLLRGKRLLPSKYAKTQESDERMCTTSTIRKRRPTKSLVTPPKKKKIQKNRVRDDAENEIQEETEVSTSIDTRSKEHDGPAEEKHCFVCGKTLRNGISLYTFTNTTKVSMIQKIDKIVTGEMDLLIEEEDLLCLRCANLLNYMDRIEVELTMLNKAILNCIRKKYGMGSRTDKTQENMLPTIECDQNNVGKLVDLNLERSPTRESNDQWILGGNAEDLEDIVNGNNYVEEQRIIAEIAPLEEIQCQICKYRTMYRSAMIFHLRQHLRNSYSCDFCNVSIPGEAVSAIERDNQVSIKIPYSTKEALTTEITVNEGTEIAVDSEQDCNNIEISNTEDTSQVPEESEMLPKSTDVLISEVPVSEDVAEGEVTYKSSGMSELASCASDSRDLLPNSSQTVTHQGLRGQTKQIRVLNEMGKIETQEIKVENNVTCFDNAEVITENATFSQFSFETTGALPDIDGGNKESEFVSNVVHTSNVKNGNYHLLNEMGMIVVTKAGSSKLVESSDIDSDANEMHVNITPGMLTYSNERKANTLKKKSVDLNGSLYER